VLGSGKLYTSLIGRAEAPWVFLSFVLDFLHGLLSPLKVNARMMLINEIIEKAGGKTGRGILTSMASTMTLADVVDVALDALCSKAREMGEDKIMLNLQIKVFESVISQGQAFYDIKGYRFASDALMSTLGSMGIRRLLSLPSQWIGMLTRLVSAATVMWRMDPSLMWLIALALGLPYFITSVISRVHARVREYMGAANRARTGSRVGRAAFVRLFSSDFTTARINNRETLEMIKFRGSRLSAMHASSRQNLIQHIFRPPTQLITEFGRIGLLIYAGNLVLGGSIQAAELFGITSISSEMMNSSRALVQLLSVADSHMM
jgi:ABC-type bacteriocin/lantibiotic exporter with double-glycine peptidase domain